MYIFNIYEIDFRYPECVSANSNFKVFIVPLNSFGKRTPLRSVEYKINVIEGSDLIKSLHDYNGTVEISTQDKTGLLKLLITSNKSLAPAVIEISIIK